ncbi:hypothetical protein EDD66_10113 [Mobilisporobacter senegalensis]|uniref:Uncharacterized protein n=1 Tax=Mobilisporobacter senegalensis TaxID=1329262 RepID=A0A3N1Y2B3_9FIRM|nr:hypothetical protein [Mobilisporobacter senegalensis]ROR31397.1 hypothetical protein EDD66_10113 [Mobilisporobacter senegalensis]
MKILIDNDLNTTIIFNNMPVGIMQAKDVMVVDGGAVSGEGAMEGDPGMYGENIEGMQKDPLLASWPFVAGISLATIVLGLTIGILLAKKRIKKGIVLYED